MATSVYPYYSTLHDTLLIVADGKLLKVTEDGISSVISGANFDVGVPASFTENKNYIWIAANSNIHQYDPFTSTVTIKAGQSPVQVTSLGFISGFLIANGNDSTGAPVPGDLWYSDDAAFNVWEVFNNEASPDALQSIHVSYSEIYAIGRDSIEVSEVSTDSDAAFTTSKSASQPFGTPAKYSVAFDQQSIYYLTVIGGSRRIARLIGGREPQIISFPVDAPIDDIDDVSGMRAFIMGYKGQSFYVSTFPRAEITIADMYFKSITLAFNIKAQEWYIWGKWQDQFEGYEAYPGVGFTYAEPWNKRYVGGNDGKLYTLSPSTFKFGTDIIRMAIRTGWRNWGKDVWKRSNLYSYDVKRGVGNSDVAAPVFTHKWRNDGKLEWSSPRVISLGAIGVRDLPQKTRQCGRYYKRQDELVFTDPCEIIFNGIEEDWD